MLEETPKLIPGLLQIPDLCYLYNYIYFLKEKSGE